MNSYIDRFFIRSDFKNYGLEGWDLVIGNRYHRECHRRPPRAMHVNSDCAGMARSTILVDSKILPYTLVSHALRPQHSLNQIK